MPLYLPRLASVTDAIQSQTTRFNETFRFPAKYSSKFAGPPNAMSESEWERFTAHGGNNSDPTSFLPLAPLTADRALHLFSRIARQAESNLSHVLLTLSATLLRGNRAAKQLRVHAYCCKLDRDTRATRV